MKGPCLSKPFLILIAAIILIAIVPAYLVLSYSVQSNSITCKRCHKEKYEQWKDSKGHPSYVSCSNCHAGGPYAPSIPPGFLADKGHVNAHCLGCHEDMPEKREFTRKQIRISHKKHFDEGVECLDCHRNVAHDDPSTNQNNRPSKSACYSCHILQIDGPSEGASCQMCHKIALTTPMKGINTIR
jgi:hypothetical protein